MTRIYPYWRRPCKTLSAALAHLGRSAEIEAVYDSLGAALGVEAEAVLLLERDERQPEREFGLRFADLARALGLAGDGSSDTARRVRGAVKRLRDSATERFDEQWTQRLGELPDWLLSSDPTE